MNSSRDDSQDVDPSQVLEFILVFFMFGILFQMPGYCSYVRRHTPHDWLGLIFIWMQFLLIISCIYWIRRNKHPGLLSDSADWPDPIRRLHSFLNDAGVETDSFSVYLLDGKPNRVLSTVVCRLSVDDEGWAAIREKLELHSISGSEGEALRNSIVSRSDESWWPASSSSVDYFSWEKEDPCTVARDEASSQAFIYYECKA